MQFSLSDSLAEESNKLIVLWFGGVQRLLSGSAFPCVGQ